jgi:hypothetical protein
MARLSSGVVRGRKPRPAISRSAAASAPAIQARRRLFSWIQSAAR